MVPNRNSRSGGNQKSDELSPFCDLDNFARLYLFQVSARVLAKLSDSDSGHGVNVAQYVLHLQLPILIPTRVSTIAVQRVALDRKALERQSRSRVPLEAEFHLSTPYVLLMQKCALENLENGSLVAGHASPSVSAKHLVGLWGEDDEQDVGGLLHAEIRVQRSAGLERLGDQE